MLFLLNRKCHFAELFISSTVLMARREGIKWIPPREINPSEAHESDVFLKS